MYLEAWKCRILELKNSFSSLHFCHIYREFNREADLLSKEAVGYFNGMIFFEESVNNIIIEKGFHTFF